MITIFIVVMMMMIIIIANTNQQVPKTGSGDVEELMACVRIEKHRNIMRFIGMLDYGGKMCLVRTR